MTAYVFRRLLMMVPMLLGIITVIFFLVRLAPGGPIVALAGEFATAEYQAAIEKLYGLDRPLFEQYWRFLWQLMQGDLGNSYFYKAPVFEVVLSRLPATLLLVVPALVLSSVLGVWLGVTASGPQRRVDVGILTVSICLNAIPIFWLGQLLLILLAVKSGLLPSNGMFDVRAGYTGWRAGLDIARHLILPCLTILLHQLAFVVLITRASLKVERQKPYFLTAMAKGNSQRRALYLHALPNGALPVVTLIGNRIGWVIAGAILVENVFAWPGLGRLIVSASLNRDYPVILGIMLVVSVLTLLANLLTDLIYGWIDPRIDLAANPAEP